MIRLIEDMVATVKAKKPPQDYKMEEPEEEPEEELKIPKIKRVSWRSYNLNSDPVLISFAGYQIPESMKIFLEQVSRTHGENEPLTNAISNFKNKIKKASDKNSNIPLHEFQVLVGKMIGELKKVLTQDKQLSRADTTHIVTFVEKVKKILAKEINSLAGSSQLAQTFLPPALPRIKTPPIQNLINELEGDVSINKLNT